MTIDRISFNNFFTFLDCSHVNKGEPRKIELKKIDFRLISKLHRGK